MPKNEPNTSGEDLLNDFQNVFISGVAVETAKYAAEESESSMISYLNSYSGGNILNPQNIPGETQDSLTRSSLDAHIKKVQADQMENMSLSQLYDLIDKDDKFYKGKKARITVIVDEKHPIHSVWLDKYSGYKLGTTKLKNITGKIEEVMLEKNILVIKPSYTRRLINPQLKNYAINITDPDTMMPLVKIEIY